MLKKRTTELCDVCGKVISIKDDPHHDVVLISGFESVNSLHDLEGGLVCNKCMFEKFAYCTCCEMWYEKEYVISTNKCVWCINQETGLVVEKPIKK